MDNLIKSLIIKTFVKLENLEFDKWLFENFKLYEYELILIFFSIKGVINEKLSRIWKN